MNQLTTPMSLPASESSDGFYLADLPNFFASGIQTVGYKDAPQRTNIDHFRYFLDAESKALMIRLSQIKSFMLTMPMVPAANISMPAQQSIHMLLKEGVREMNIKIRQFNRWLNKSGSLTAGKAQKQYALLKLQFNWLLDQVDIFADVMTQRSEHQTGIWLAGMDALAKDTLNINGRFYQSPPLITYLDRGHGAAIRRARTRLPGGKSNPVGVIRVPRERMISTGIASSLVHEVGHQGAALLNLVATLKAALQRQAQSSRSAAESWQWYERWISEILSDFWSVAMIGIGSTTGLMNVVSVPSYFVFRLNKDGPHPPPWIRVRLSIAFGAYLYPDRQWLKLQKLWGQLYPLRLANANDRDTYRQLELLIPSFVELFMKHRPPKLKGHSLQQAFTQKSHKVRSLRKRLQQWKGTPDELLNLRPSLVFALIGQARADGQISPDKEQMILDKMLRSWALKNTGIHL